MNHNEAEKKAKRKAYMQAWWLKNKESATIKHKEWLEANKDKVKAYTKKYKSNRSELQRKKDAAKLESTPKQKSKRTDIQLLVSFLSSLLITIELSMSINCCLSNCSSSLG